ncbi:MAG TPA: DUF4386 domain-containing protein [Nitrospirota bacterium]|nr:DUF4386 domain-containing protein [Nitrospirota bacterium]
MRDHNADASLSRITRVAGFLFLLTFIFPTINFLLLSKFMVPENVIATANNIMADELLFRIGILNELIISALAVVFGLTLYIILRSVKKDIALLALFFKLTEAILLAVVALGHFIALLILDERASLTVFGPEQIQALAGSFINLYFYTGAVGLVFHGLNSTVFLYLFFKSKYVPRELASFGILSYALVFMYAVIMILAPDHATKITVQTICLAPSILLELLLGLWLLIKGLNVQPQDDPAPGSA